MQKVTLRYKLVCKGKMESLYLQYYPPLTDKNGNLVRYEFLHKRGIRVPVAMLRGNITTMSRNWQRR